MAAALKNSTHLLWTLRMLVAAALGMGALLALVPAGGHDQLWFLLMAERWVHGATLYGAEIFDSNTPAVVWLSSIPVLMGERSGMSAEVMGKLLVVLLEVGIAFLSLHILRLLEPSMGKAQRMFLGFAFVNLFAVAAARDFGQRDHLAAVLCLPYVLMAGVGRLGSFRLRALAGLLAAVGVCLKPQQALVLVAIEAALLIAGDWVQRGAARRSLSRLASLVERPEPLVFVVAGALFLEAIHHWAPLFFSLALPTLRATYWAIGHLTAGELFLEALQLHGLAGVAIGLHLWVIRKRPESPLRPAIRMLLIAGAGATASYYLQGTGWYYQQLPGICFLGSAIALEGLVIVGGRNVSVPRWAPVAAVGVGLLAIGLTIHYSGYPFSREMFSADRRYAIATPDPSFFSGLTPGTPVATLTTSVDDAMMPVFRYRLTWAQRTNNLWMLPAIFRAGDSGSRERVSASRLAELSAQQRRWMVEDLQRWQPRLVMVERCESPDVHCQELEDRHDNLLAFFLADPGFARIWGHYRFVRGSGPYDAFELEEPF